MRTIRCGRGRGRGRGRGSRGRGQSGSRGRGRGRGRRGGLSSEVENRATLSLESWRRNSEVFFMITLLLIFIQLLNHIDSMNSS